MCHIIYLQFGINNFLRLITSWYKNKNDNGAKVKQRDDIARRTTSSNTLLVWGEDKEVICETFFGMMYDKIVPLAATT